MTIDPLWLLICGGRRYGVVLRSEIATDVERASKEREFGWLFLDKVVALRGIPARVIQGGAPGGDALGKRWAERRGYTGQTVGADWSRLGRAAGRKRNETMLTILRSMKATRKLVVALPGEVGTQHMIDISRAAGIEVLEAGKIIL